MDKFVQLPGKEHPLVKALAGDLPASIEHSPSVVWKSIQFFKKCNNVTELKEI